MKWYKRDPDAALIGMHGLTLEERGAYNTIIDFFYSRDGVVPDDDWLLSRVLECNPRTWAKLKIGLFAKQKLTVNSANCLVPNRGEATLNEARSFSETQSNRALKRWEKSKNRNNLNGSHMPSSAMPAAHANTTTTTTTPLTPFENGFDKFWNSYPRKVGKEAAAKAYAKALKHVSLIEILEALEKQKPQWRDPQFIPHPASWLNAGRWADELPMAKPPGREGWV
jgi:uncharacterized protein YdaU (DUF1376 family)